MNHRKFAVKQALFPALLGLLASSAVVTAYAEENLLWKTINTISPTVVPAYGGQGSPFPKTQIAAPVVATSNSEVLDEQERLRAEAMAKAQSMLQHGDALMPEIRTITVGGMVEGSLGPRALINNQWQGIGSRVLTRQYKTQAVQDAIKAVSDLDAEAGQTLSAQVNAELAAHPAVALTLQRITSSSLVLLGPKGPITIKINLN